MGAERISAWGGWSGRLPRACLAAAGLLEWGSGQLERFGEAAQSVLSVAEAGLSRVGVEPFSRPARGQRFSFASLPFRPAHGERMGGGGLEVGFWRGSCWTQLHGAPTLGTADDLEVRFMACVLAG